MRPGFDWAGSKAEKRFPLEPARFCSQSSAILPLQAFPQNEIESSL